MKVISLIIFWGLSSILPTVAQERSSIYSLNNILNDVQYVFNQLQNPFQFSQRHTEQIISLAVYQQDPLTQKPYQTLGKRDIPFIKFPAKEVTESTRTILWVGGIHADEFAPTLVSWRFLLYLLDNPEKLPQNHHLIFIPMLNLDGWIDGYQKYGYPTRKNGRKVDLNRSFYDPIALPNYRSESETELVMALIEQYQPEYWIIPHSTLNILDLDGPKTPDHLDWLQQIHEGTKYAGATPIPIKFHGVYSPPNSRKKWSIGKYANEMSTDNFGPASLTYEFGGPGEYPRRNDPDRALKISKRKHLGRYENNTYIADQYFEDYLYSLIISINNIK